MAKIRIFGKAVDYLDESNLDFIEENGISFMYSEVD